jgi:dGTPase
MGPRQKSPKLRHVTWDKLLNSTRLGCETHPEWSDDSARSEYQRDFDRVAFSHAFRRLQGKTQVFPLPENDLVHNRLTHSVESSCVGRFLGGLVARQIGQPVDLFSSVVSAACLAHDIGNPPFGHSGEAAIADFFEHGEGAAFMKGLTQEERSDFTCFEGNAMALRMLCHSKPARTSALGGKRLTYTTLAAFAKYPRVSHLKTVDHHRASQKKFGVFRSELQDFRNIAEQLQLSKPGSDDCWYRHPLAFLVEAADDICYKVGDAEDGLKMNYMARDEIIPILRRIAEAHFPKNEISQDLAQITAPVETIGYLRAKATNSLIYQCAAEFCRNETEILTAEYDTPLLDSIESISDLQQLTTLTAERIYLAPVVVQIEAAGYKVLPGLLNALLQAILNESGTTLGQKITQNVPPEFRPAKDAQGHKSASIHETIMGIVEFVSGMTDRHAIQLFRILNGISHPGYG